jgi:hypothetical protein
LAVKGRKRKQDLGRQGTLSKADTPRMSRMITT